MKTNKMKAQHCKFMKTLNKFQSIPETPAGKFIDSGNTDMICSPLASMKNKLSPIRKKDNLNIMKVDKDSVIGLANIPYKKGERIGKSWQFSLKCTSLQGGNLLSIPVIDFKHIILQNPSFRETFEDCSNAETQKIAQ